MLKTKEDNSSSCMYYVDTVSAIQELVCFLFVFNNFDRILLSDLFQMKQICDICADKIT